MVKKVFFFLLFLLGFALAINALSYSNFDPTYGFLRLKQQAIATGWYLPAYYAHVLVSAFILVAGFIQVTPAIRNRWKNAHRYLGTFYVLGVLFLAAPGGLIMSFFINRGPLVQASFLMQCGLWFYFTGMAYAKARKKDYGAHELWMWRSFALTLAAISLRLYIFIVSFMVDLHRPYAYATIAWLSWTLNLLLVEFGFRARPRPFAVTKPQPS
jgi:hypothetical protein